jgi:hypothetical protein
VELAFAGDQLAFVKEVEAFIDANDDHDRRP